MSPPSASAPPGGPGSGEWHEISIPTAVAVSDDVAALIAAEVEEAGSGIEVRGAEIVFWVPAERQDQALRETRAAATRLAEAGFAVDAAGVRARPAPPESEWRDAWKRDFRATRLTRSLTVVPSWDEHAPAPGEISLHLDPGQAFGTGTHASTRRILEALDDHHHAGAEIERFLDVGAGSGILSIAAARLWPAASGLAIDDDPRAVDAAADNAARNQVADRVACASTPLADIDEAFDLVVANIQSDVLLAMRADLAARLRPGGRLVLSGLLAVQVAEVAARFAELGLQVIATLTGEPDPEWTALVLRREAPSR
jgi:ribosomal protein L11 methyltransferase